MWERKIIGKDSGHGHIGAALVESKFNSISWELRVLQQTNYTK
jgi:hypothetical protein